MRSTDRFNPINTLSTIIGKHDGMIDASTMQSYLSFISFLSLFNIYQSFAPQAPVMNSNSNDLSGMLNQFMGGNSSFNSDSLGSLLNNKQGIASLLSSVPPEALSMVSSMLGSDSPQASEGSKKTSNPLGGLLSMAASNPALLSMLSGGLGGKNPGLGSLLGGGGGSGLGSLLGGGGGSGLGSLLGGLGGKTSGMAPLLSLLGGSKGGNPLNALLGGGKGGNPLNALLGGGKGLGSVGLGELAAFAPLLPYVSTVGKKVHKKVKQTKQRKRERRAERKAQKEMQSENHFKSLLEKTNLGKYAPLVPHMMAIAGTANTQSALPLLLPLVMGNNKKSKKKTKALPKNINTMPKKNNLPAKNSGTIENNLPVKNTLPLKNAIPVKNSVPIRPGVPVKKTFRLKKDS